MEPRPVQGVPSCPRFSVWKGGGFRGGVGPGRGVREAPFPRSPLPPLPKEQNRTEGAPEAGPRPLGRFAPGWPPEERRRLLGRGRMLGHTHADGMPPSEGKGPEGKEGMGPEGMGPEGMSGDGPYYRYPGAVLLPVHRVPRDYLACSLFTFSYANCCCLGLAALVFSIKSRDSKVIGDAEGAEENGKTARCLNAFALSMLIVFIITFIIVFATSIPSIYNRFLEAISDGQENGSHKPVSRN
uniref:Uncharacterized protein n=1 Tax=Anolis carolinensis TaxID=28377 RepID=A0A803U1A2_ANOCA|nr:PREDICTED: uncharacterized protein LOC103278592 [Anolis carolinensis]|eukprot:XP_008107138.1 PREDICTED: uncharacterized protein LOC103278592 [Anolis carolinensis]